MKRGGKELSNEPFAIKNDEGEREKSNKQRNTFDRFQPKSASIDQIWLCALGAVRSTRAKARTTKGNISLLSRSLRAHCSKRTNFLF
jgi:hypothetical protein